MSTDALYLVTWAFAEGPGLIAADLAEARIGAAELGTRGETSVRVEELLHIDAETGIETKVFRNAAGNLCVRVYDLEVGETTAVSLQAHLAVERARRTAVKA